MELIKDDPIILSKQKDMSTTISKEKAWTLLENKYNSNQQVVKRDMASLKVCLLNLQAKAKKESAMHASQLKKTGGGPPPEAMSGTSATLVELLPQVFQPLDVNDDDACKSHFTSQSFV